MYTDYGDYMKLRYQNKDIELIECKSFFSRFKGFMMCKNINHALLFGNCNSIHTFFMISNIDVILCNDDNVILYYYKDLINPKNKQECFNSSFNPEIVIYKDTDFVYHYYVDLSNNISNNNKCDISNENALIDNMQDNLKNKLGLS